MNVLLIGGTGILSSDIKEYAIEKEYNVFILNRGINKVKNKNNRVHSIICDIRDINSAKNALDGYSFDVVVDFISFSVEQLKMTLEVTKGKCKQFIFVSSATAYRITTSDEKITERTILENPDWDYARNKIACEEYLTKNYNRYCDYYTIVRPYVTYSDARIPFAIIPHNMQWTLVNRIINDKPVILWDGGRAVCTLTYAKDFAVGFVGLFENEKAYNEDFHITSDYTMTWKEVLLCVGKALGKDVQIADIPTDYLLRYMPEKKGEILGDKGRDRIFDNTKIKKVVPEFTAKTKFEDGIKNVISFYENNDYMRNIDYSWDGRIDRIIDDYYKNNSYKSIVLQGESRSYKEKQSFYDKIAYFMSYHNSLYPIYMFMQKICNKVKFEIKRRNSLKGYSNDKNKQ